MSLKDHIDLFEESRMKIRNAYISAVLRLSSTVLIGEFTKLIDDGNIEGAIALLAIDNSLIDDVIEEVRIAYRKQGTLHVRELKPPPDIRRVRSAAFTFEVLGNPRAEEWLQAESSQLIVEVVEQQKQLVRSVITENVARGNNPRTVAQQIVGKYNRATRKREGGILGLTTRQEQWVTRTGIELETGDYHAYLRRRLRDRRFDKSVKRAIREGVPLTKEIRERMVLAYRRRALRYRGEVIGRTESLRAANVSQMHALEGVIEKGGIRDRQNAKREWQATLGSPRTRDTHADVHGQIRTLDETWTVGNSELRYPGDPLGEAKETIQCRCHTVSVVDWLAEAYK